MSAIEALDPREPIHPHTEVIEKGGHFVAEPPVGQLAPKLLFSMNREELETFAHEHSAGLEGLFAPEALPLLDHPRTSSTEFTAEDRIRAALLYADGRSWREIATAFVDAREPDTSKQRRAEEAERIFTVLRVQGNNWFSQDAEELAQASVEARKRHSLLSPERPETEISLKHLEDTLGLPRDEIFYFRPTDEAFQEAEAARVKPTPLNPMPYKGKYSLYSPHVAARIVEMLFCEKATTDQLYLEAETLLGRSLGRNDMSVFLSRAVTGAAWNAAYKRLGIKRKKRVYED